MDKVNQYFASKALNVSTMKNLDNPKWVRLKQMGLIEDEEKRHFRIGSAIDCILTDPDRFNDEFMRLPARRPSDMMVKFIEVLASYEDDVKSSSINEVDAQEEMAYSEKYEEAYKASGFKISMTRVINKLKTDTASRNYYKALKKATNKTLLSTDEWEEVKHCKEYLLGNPYTRKFFMNTDPNIEILYQVPIYFTYKDVECKALLDGIIIDKEKKRIQPFDLKTTAFSVSGSAFKGKFLKMGYYLQAAHYDNALWAIVHDPILTRAPLELKEYMQNESYQIDPMRFVVTEKKVKHSNPARIFRCTENDLKFSKNGGTTRLGDYYPGVDELVDTYKWHKDEDYWDLPKSMVDSEGEEVLDVFVS